MQINATEMKKGTVIELADGLWVITDTMHMTPGNKRGFIQAKIKSLADGHVLQRKFRSTDRVEKAFLEGLKHEYLYEEPPSFVFMDQQSFEQLRLDAAVVGEQMKYIRHNSTVNITFHNGKPISIDLPAAVVLEVKQTDPGMKGDTVSNVFKPATLETGLVVKVPLYINEGNSIKVDTRSGDFVERVNQ